MARIGGSGAVVQMLQQQADAEISQANPVSATLYEVLATTKNVKIISMMVYITWAVTQPTPLEIVVTVDGKTLIFSQANPVSGTWYTPVIAVYDGDALQIMANSVSVGSQQAFENSSGRSVRVQVRVTWATTQPTPLVCRVKYAKIP